MPCYEINSSHGTVDSRQTLSFHFWGSLKYEAYLGCPPLAGRKRPERNFIGFQNLANIFISAWHFCLPQTLLLSMTLVGWLISSHLLVIVLVKQGWCNPLHMRFNCSFDASAKLQPFALGISHSPFSFQTSRSINISWHGAAYGYEDDEGKWHSGVICFSGCHRSRDRFSCNMISGCIQIGVWSNSHRHPNCLSIRIKQTQEIGWSFYNCFALFHFLHMCG